jgi:putative membrane protein
MNTLKFVGLGIIFVNLGVSLAACDDDDDAISATGGSSAHGATAGRGGTTSGRSGSGGTAAAGRGGTAGTPSRGGAGGSAGTGRAGRGGGDAGGEAGESSAAALDDPEILHVALTANQGEVAEGQVAVTRASSTKVQAFAEMMVNDHSEAVDDVMALSESSGIGLRSNPTSDALATDADATVEALTAVSDDDFDAVYMQSQVATHEQVLTLLRSTLIAQADDDDLRALLSKMESTVEEHLSEAKDVKDAL